MHKLMSYALQTITLKFVGAHVAFQVLQGREHRSLLGDGTHPPTTFY